MFIDAIKQLNQIYYSTTGSRTDFPAGRVSYWFKQDEIHQSSHVHGCPAFLPWHRELLNRFEALLRSVHPELSLHYWDWNLDPSNMRDKDGNRVNLFDHDFMGNANGLVEEPLRSAGFYVENSPDGNFRDDHSPVVLTRSNPNDPTTWSYPQHGNPADPPRILKRDKWDGAPPVGQTTSHLYWPTDSELINAPTWESFNDFMQGAELESPTHNGAHALAHSYIGGNMTRSHLSFRDPFVFLVHSNVDRLWAMWQRKDPAVRLDPSQVYGTEENTQGVGDVEKGEPRWGILSPLMPWAGSAAQTAETGIITSLWPIRPWAAPENVLCYKNAKDISIVTPPRYDTSE